MGVLARARVGVLNIFPVLGILGLKFRDTVVIPGHPYRAIRGYESRPGPRDTAFPVPRVDHAHDQQSFVLPLGNSTRCRSTLLLFLYHPYWPGATLHHDGSGGAGALGDTCGIITPSRVVPAV